MNPKYPIYVISKGRADRCQTVQQLKLLNIPFKLVIEPQEYKLYSKIATDDEILCLPFSNLGLGSIPARNWVWEHSLNNGDKRHWILDDNISAFSRLNRNVIAKVTDGTIFKCCEDFTDRYENVALSGMNYEMFIIDNEKYPAYYLNTRIYSCILIQNNLPFRWRGKYNEDTDLSLRVLKNGYCTILFNAFMCRKMTTMKMKGGNTDELYAENGRTKMAMSLQEQHPDVVKIVWKHNRWHHQVNYKRFKNNLIRKDNLNIIDGIDNYGMSLTEI